MRPMNIMQHLNEGENETKKCVICGKTYKGWGNDAWPVADGYCCDKCNNDKVLPARIAQMYGLKESSVSNDKSAINKRIKEIKKELDYCRRRDEVCATFGSEQQVYELEKELKELESKLNELDESDEGEYKDFTVTIGFLGGYGSGDCDGTKDYEVSAKSRADAVAQVLDNPDAEAPQDLEVSSIEKIDGDWEVVVAFGAGGYNPGYHTYTEDGSFSEEDAKSSALDEAQCDGDLYVEAVDGTPFDYEMGESAGMINEEGKVKDSLLKRQEDEQEKKDAYTKVAEDVKREFPDIRDDIVNKIISDLKKVHKICGNVNFYKEVQGTWYANYDITISFSTEDNVIALCYDSDNGNCIIYYEGPINNYYFNKIVKVKQSLNI